MALPFETEIRPGEIRRAVFRLAVPAVLEMILHMFMWVMDTALVGRLGSGPLAAAALGGQVFYTAVFVFGAVGVGAMALVARHSGARHREEASRAAGQAILLAFVLGMAGMFAVRSAAPWVFALATLSPDITALGMDYVRVLSLGTPLMVVILVANGVLRGRGDTKSPFYVTLLTNIIGPVLQYALIFGAGPFPRLGLYGAALAPVIAWVLGLIMALGIVFGVTGKPATTLAHVFSWAPRDMWRLARLSLPAAFESLLMDGARTANIAIIGVLGSSAIAANQIAATCESLSFMPGHGFAIASSIIAGQALGAGEPAYARRGAYESWRVAAGVMGLVGFTYVLFARAYVGLFTQEAPVLALGASALMVAGFAQVFVATTEVLTGALRGAGDTRTSMLITLLGTWLIRVPATFLVARRFGLGLQAVWVVMLVDWAIRAIFASVWFRMGKWEKVKV